MLELADSFQLAVEEVLAEVDKYVSKLNYNGAIARLGYLGTLITNEANLHPDKGIALEEAQVLLKNAIIELGKIRAVQLIIKDELSARVPRVTRRKGRSRRLTTGEIKNILTHTPPAELALLLPDIGKYEADALKAEKLYKESIVGICNLVELHKTDKLLKSLSYLN